MKIALLGGTGFAGQNVSKALKMNDYEFYPVSRHNGYDLRDLKHNLNFIEEINPDVIINCAAHVGSLNYVSEFAADVISDNTRMILNLYEALKITEKKIVIVQPLANCAYPADAVVYKESEFWNGPLHPSIMSFGSTRRMMWSIAECYYTQHGVRTVNLITPNMYGPYDSTDPNKAHALNALISKFVKAIHTGQKEVEIWGTGAAIREWLHVGDFAEILILVIKNINDNKYNHPVNIAQNFGLSVKQLVDLILKYIDYSGTVWYNTEKPDGAPKKVMDNSEFSKVFPGFHFTSFEEGIKSTAVYYHSVYPY